MNYNFEQFTDFNRSFAPKLSIRPNGQIGLSQGLLRRVGIGEGEWYAYLFFDPKHRAMGLKFTQSGDDVSVIKVQKRESATGDGGKNWSGHLSARSFLDYYKIDYRDRKSQGFTPTFGEDGMVIVLLRDGVEEEEPDEDDLPAAEDPPDSTQAPNQQGGDPYRNSQ